MEVGESGELRGGDITACSQSTSSQSAIRMNRRRGALIIAPDPKTVLRESDDPIGPSPRLSSSPARTELGTIFEGGTADIENTSAREQGAVGLKNLGNTCYMNSGLQCLLHEPQCFMFFANSNLNLNEAGTKGIHHKSLTYEFHKLLLQYWNGMSREIAPENFKYRLGQVHEQFEGYYQHDGQEFLALLLDRLHVELTEAKKRIEMIQTNSDPTNSDQSLSRGVSSDDSAFLSAGSSTELNVETTLPALLPPKSTPEQSSPISDLGSDTTRTRKRQSSDSSQNSDPNPASPDSSGSVNYAFNQLNVSLQDADDKETQPAKRPRLTSECTLESANPDVLWKKYIGENESLISSNFQGQFASELTCKKCKHRFMGSKTYEPFMYLTVPVPNPSTRIIKVNFSAPHGSPGMFVKIAVTIDREATISVLMDKLKDELKSENIQTGRDLRLYELHNDCLKREHRSSDLISYISNQPETELFLIEPKDLTSKPERTEQTGGYKCVVCFDEHFQSNDIFTHEECNFYICDGCYQGYRSNPNSGFDMDGVCQNCKKAFDGYKRPSGSSQRPPEETFDEIISTVTFRDSDKNAVSLPIVVNINKKINSTLLYEMIQMYLCQVTDNFETYPIHYTDMSGSFCSRCPYNACPSQFGCIVPEDYEIELKNYDHFTVICNSKIDQIKWRKSENYIELSQPHNRPTLSNCLSSFISPEELDDDSVYCQKCEKNTGATKIMSVQRWPDTLIIYLKRFVFEMTAARKIETEVIFELNNLTLDELASPGGEKPDAYNLIGSIQHFGGIHAGHYTAYAKDPFSKCWNYFNDGDCSSKSPSDADAQSVYILFYRREHAVEPSPSVLQKLVDQETAKIEDELLNSPIKDGSPTAPGWAGSYPTPVNSTSPVQEITTEMTGLSNLSPNSSPKSMSVNASPTTLDLMDDLDTDLFTVTDLKQDDIPDNLEEAVEGYA